MGENIYGFLCYESVHVREDFMRFKDKYFFEYNDEIFQVALLVVLHEWLDKLVKCQHYFYQSKVDWTIENLLKMQMYDNFNALVLTHGMFWFLCKCCRYTMYDFQCGAQGIGSSSGCLILYSQVCPMINNVDYVLTMHSGDVNNVNIIN